MGLQDVQDVIADHSGYSRHVLEYCLATKKLVDESKEPGFDIESLAPLAELVSIDTFERVGNFKETMNWDDYTGFLAAWMPTAAWECSFRRITEIGNLVFLELEERAGSSPHAAVNSASIYEFDDDGRIRHLDVYLQMAMPGGPPPTPDADRR